MTRKNLVLAFLALTVTAAVPADSPGQPPEDRRGPPRSDAMKLQFELHPSALVSDPLPGTFEEVLETTVNTARFELQFPLVLAPPRTVVLGAVHYRFLRFDHTNWIADDAPYVPQEFHSLGLEITLRRLIGQQWGLIAHVKPALASDFKGIDSDHVNITGGMVLSRRVSAALQLGLGGGYLNDFGKPMALPLLHVIWTPPGKDYALTALLPRQAAFWYQYRPTVQLGVVAQMEGNRYRIGEEFAEPVDALDFGMGTVGPSVDAELGRGASNFVATAGLSFLRKFELRDGDGDTDRELDLEFGYFLRAGITFKR